MMMCYMEDAFCEGPDWAIFVSHVGINPDCPDAIVSMCNRHRIMIEDAFNRMPRRCKCGAEVRLISDGS
jgi:hypothetical protein